MIIEKKVLNYLKNANTSVKKRVYCEVPEKEPQEYILIEKIGGGRSDRIDLARIDIQSCSAKSLERAMKINEEIKAAMDEFPYQDPEIFSCTLNYDNNFTNPATKIYRYQAGFNISY